jgi:glycerol-3-phosphate acyltransferase PlsX
MTARFAVDAMGGDHAPRSTVEGAVMAARELGLAVSLVGREETIREELARHEVSGLDLEVVPAREVVSMDDPPAQATRQKRDSSLRVGVRLVKEGRAAGFVSAGPTGAVWVTAKIVLGLIEGVDRPALAAVMPSRNKSGVTVMLDVGANLNCSPEQLMQFAVMGHLYGRSVLGIPDPRIGLLSVGEEDTKGTDDLREVGRVLRETRLNFVGNAEGNDIFNGRIDVVVCDGFVGNVALKVSEGILEAAQAIVRADIQENVRAQMGYLLMRPTLRGFRKRVDYAEYGGVPLLGVRGCVIIGHGRSSAKAIKNALRAARDYVAGRVAERIHSEIRLLAETKSRLDE